MPTVGGYSDCNDDYGDDFEVIVLFAAIIMTPMVMFVVIVVMITVVALTIIAIVVVILVHIVLMAIMFVVTAWCDRISHPGFGRILFRVRKSCHKGDFRLSFVIIVIVTGRCHYSYCRCHSISL